MVMNVADISRYQAGIDQHAILKANGCHAVITGVTFGSIGVNPYYADELNATAREGMCRGAYHIRAGNGPTYQAEAQHFLDYVTPFLDRNTILVLDWEECDTSQEDWALGWLNYVFTATGIRPWFYVNLADLNLYRYPKIAAAGYAVWLAAYPYNSVGAWAGSAWTPQAIPAGHTLAAWQYVGTGGYVGSYAGIDLSAAYITPQQWAAYATPAGAPPVDPVPPAPPVVQRTDWWFTVATDAEVAQLKILLVQAFSDAALVGTVRDRWREIFWAEPGGQINGQAGTMWSEVVGIGNIVQASQQQLQQAITLLTALSKTAPSAPAAQPIDVKALAAQLAPLLNTETADQFAAEVQAAVKGLMKTTWDKA